MNQIGRKKIGGHGPFKLKILLLNRYVKGTIFQWNDRENRGVDIFLLEYQKNVLWQFVQNCNMKSWPLALKNEQIKNIGHG